MIRINQCSSDPSGTYISEGVYATGAWVVVENAWISEVLKPEAAKRIFETSEFNMPIDMWQKLGLPVLTKESLVVQELNYIESKITR